MKTRLLALFLVLLLALTACAGKSKPQSDAQPFRVGMECAYAPFNWTQTDDKNGAVPIEGSAEFAGGYDVEIAKQIAEGLGRPLVVVKTDWDGLPPAVVSGKIDAIIAGMSPLEERKETLDFTDHYYRSDFIVIVQGDGDYAAATKLSDLAGARLSAQLNTNHYPAIDQIPGAEKLDAMDSFNTLRMALLSGKIDGYVAERPEGFSVEAALPELKALTFEEGHDFQVADEDIVVSVALNKGSTLVDPINKILAGISEDNRQKLMEEAIANQPIVDD